MATGHHRRHLRVNIKQRRMRVISRQQREQQLVEVVARQQGITGRHDMATYPLRALEGADFSVTTKAQAQRLKWQQYRPEIRTWPLRSLGHQGDTPLVPREHLKDQAGLAPIVAVQHIGRFVRDTLRSHVELSSRPAIRGFAAGPPQGETGSLGGQRSTRSGKRGGQRFTRSQSCAPAPRRRPSLNAL